MVIRRTDLYNEEALDSNALTQNIINLPSPHIPLTPDDNR